MRKLFFLCLTALLAVACVKERLVTKPCGFEVKIDWAKGSRMQFTVTPSDKDATYSYGIMLKDQIEEGKWTDKDMVEWELNWMNQSYQGIQKEGAIGTMTNMFCYKGPRTIKEERLSFGKDWVLYVFQMNPETNQAIGPLYKASFSTLPVQMEDIGFSIIVERNSFTITPSDPDRTWFWEYESETKIDDVFGSPFAFFYNVIGMYDQYDFLENILCTGPETWTLPADDRSVREGVKYTIAMAGCEDGEITSDVYYADFIFRNGVLEFPYSDVPLRFAGN